MNTHRLFQLSLRHGCSLLLMVAISLTASATDVYVSRDKDGSVVFSDKPSRGSETHKVKQLPVVPAFVAPAKTSQPAAPSADKKTSYTSLSIVSPQDGTQLPTGAAGSLNVNGVLSPGLQPGDTIELIDNGQRIKQGQQTSFALEYLDRGEHQLQLQVVNAKGDVIISSNLVTVYIQRHSVLKRR